MTLKEDVVDDAEVNGVHALLTRTLQRGSHCTTVRFCPPCRESNRQALALTTLLRTYQRKAERQKSSKKLSRIAGDVHGAASSLEVALRQPCQTPGRGGP